MRASSLRSFDSAMTKSPVKLAGELPKMVVFDLDFTLWDLWCDTHVTPPLARRGDELNRVHDRHGQPLSFYRDVPAILFQLHHSNIQVAAASRTHAPKVARQILSELLLPGSRRDSGRDPLKAHGDGEKKETVSAIKLFDSMEIYPGSKMDHFRELNRKTGIPFNQMVSPAPSGLDLEARTSRSLPFYLITTTDFFCASLSCSLTASPCAFKRTSRGRHPARR